MLYGSIVIVRDVELFNDDVRRRPPENPNILLRKPGGRREHLQLPHSLGRFPTHITQLPGFHNTTGGRAFSSCRQPCCQLQSVLHRLFCSYSYCIASALRSRSLNEEVQSCQCCGLCFPDYT